MSNKPDPWHWSMMFWAAVLLFAMGWHATARGGDGDIDQMYDFDALTSEGLDPDELGERLTIIHDPDAGDAWYARIVVRNGPGSTTRVYQFDTAHGRVSVAYVTTGNGGGGCCPDRIEVRDLPDGIEARPRSMLLNEHDTETIFLMIHMGF